MKTDLALDDGPFGPMPASLDLAKRAPSRLRFKPQGADAPYEVAVRYTDTGANVSAAISKDGKPADIEVTFRGLDGIDIPGRVAPVLRVSPVREPTEAELSAAL